jgi:GT2 family glycosyltransferase
MVEVGRTGVVTVTFNSSKVIAGFMDSLLSQTHQEFLLYVIDNASSDDTLEKLDHCLDQRVVVMGNQDNLGVAAGNNQGITAALAAGCQSVLLINNDTEFAPDLLEKLLTGLEEQRCDMIVPKIMYHDRPHVIWAAGGYFSRWRAYATLHYGQGQYDSGQYDVPRRIDYAPTCCLLIRRSVFDLIGLMDETYFVYFDDADFCWRARRAALSLFYYPQARLLHRESSATGGVKSRFTARYSARNKVYFLRKNLSIWQWPLWAAFYEVYLLGRLILGEDGPDSFRVKQRSFRAGLSLKGASSTDAHRP